MQEWLINAGIVAGFVGSVVHLFPNVLTQVVNKRLFSVAGVSITPQRIVGAVGSVVLAGVVWGIVA